MLRWRKLTRRQARLYRHTAIALGVGLLFALLALVDPFQGWQWRFSDQLVPSRSPSPNIILVAIDDKSLEQRKWSEWSRSIHAQAITNLAKARAKVIALDILFANPSAEDAVLREAIENAHYEIGDQEVKVPVVQPIAGQSSPISTGQEGITYGEMLFPISDLRGASTALGHANVLPDWDGVVRRLFLVVKDREGNSYPSMVVSVLYTFRGQTLPEQYPVTSGAIRILAGDFFERDIPVDVKRSMRINYAGTPGTFLRLSYIDVVNDQFDPNLVKGKIVLVGMMATGEPDSWSTPTSAEKMFGVEIYANALDTILQQRFLTEASRGATFWTTLLLATLVAMLLPRLNLRWGGILTAGFLVGYVVIAFLSFGMRDYILNLIYPTLVLPVVYVTSLVLRVLGEQADKRQVKDLFGRYVSPDVASEIMRLSDSGELRLGGEQREVTVLFADMRGFARISEQLGPEGIVSLLNKYLSAIIARVLANEGMVNKFAGDNIMGVWNVPRPDLNHAFLAVKAAWEAQQAIKSLREQNPDLPMVQFGMGVNTGEAVAGNMGSEGRSEYTVIGDAVNLSSRLCAAAPGDEIWIGPRTYELVKEKVPVEALEPQMFKGKKEPVPVHKVSGLTSSS